MSDIFGDLRFALRGFIRSPLHAGLTVLILGLGIGAVTLMFSAINASVLRPLPYPEPDRLVWAWKASDAIPQNSLSYDDFRDYKGSLSVFKEMGAFLVFNPQLLVTGAEEAERVQSTLVTPNFFNTLGIPPALGRSFFPEEAVLGGPFVAILSHAYWQGRLGGDPSVIGRTLTMDGTPTEIVGVMPAGFEFMGNVEVWLPAQEGSPPTLGRGNNNFFFVGRLAEGVTLERAQLEIDAVGRSIQEANPDFANWYHWIQPLHEVFFGSMRNILFVLFGIVSLVPLLACANVASLSLTRATSRSTELATRLALGAARGRVLRQLVLENLLLAFMGGALGLALALGGGGLLRSLGPATLPRLDEIGIDGQVMGFALIASLLTVPLFGLLPALRGTDFDLASALRFGGRGGGEGRSRLRSVLVITQVALSMTLLIASGLLFRSFQSLQAVDPGFRIESLLTAGIQIPDYKFENPQELGLAWTGLLDRVRGIPGVEGAAAADWLPVTPGQGPWNGLSRPEHPLEEGEQGTPGRRKMVSVGYFETLEAPMVAGRTFTRDDTPDTSPVMILSEALSTTLFPDESPLGRIVNLWGMAFEVVGVSGRVADSGLGVVGRPTFFVSAGQFPQASLQLAVRTSGDDPLSTVSVLREALREQDPDIALTNLQTMEARVAGTLTQPRFRTTLVGAFALAGLLLAAFGLYGVLAFLVTRRQHEIGIRMAVGARGGDVFGLVLRHGLALVGIGVALGMVGGLMASILLQGLLFGIATADPVTLGGSSLILLLVATVASAAPAWKATRVDPLEALRAE